MQDANAVAYASVEKGGVSPTECWDPMPGKCCML